MENRDDKLIAVIGLLSASLITVVFIFAMIWFSEPADLTPDTQSCDTRVCCAHLFASSDPR